MAKFKKSMQGKRAALVQVEEMAILLLSLRRSVIEKPLDGFGKISKKMRELKRLVEAIL